MNYRTLSSWFSARLLPCLICSQALVAAPFAYVTNSSDNTVSVVDLATNLVTGAPITVGNFPYFTAITPDGAKVYVTNFNDSSVSVINTSTNIAVATIPVSGTPTGIVISPDGLSAYVCSDDLPTGTVSVIDTAADTVVGVPIPIGLVPQGIAITPDGSKAYVCNNMDNTVSVINTITQVATPITVGVSPYGIAITPDGANAYVTNQFDGTVSVINTATKNVVKNIPVGRTPEGIVITEDGSKAYVVQQNSNTVFIIDTVSDTVQGSPVSVGHKPIDIVLTPFQTIDAPRKFIGKIVRHRNDYWRKTTLSMRWKKSTSSRLDHYEIFASGKLIATIPASAELKFQKTLQPYVCDKRLSKKYLHYLRDKYRIRAVASNGVTSSLKKLKVKQPIAYKIVSNILVNQEQRIP